MKNKRQCPSCFCDKLDKGRAFDGRRAYRCKKCNHVWTEGMQGREQKFHSQRLSFQFADSKGNTHQS